MHVQQIHCIFLCSRVLCSIGLKAGRILRRCQLFDSFCSVMAYRIDSHLGLSDRLRHLLFKPDSKVGSLKKIPCRFVSERIQTLGLISSACVYACLNT